MEVLLPIAAGVSCLIAVGAVVYRTVRPRFPVTVNCWFCNKDTKVPFGNRDCWDCPKCEQYNGFTLDGDYNKLIPSQYLENLNHPITSENKSPSKTSDTSRHGVLCDLCNRNQVLKMRQLADFVPENELNYDYEVECYKRYLERIYKLCYRCERGVEETLGKQDNSLEKKLEAQLRNSVQQPDVSASDSFNTSHMLCEACAPFHVCLLRVLTCLCAPPLLCATIVNLLMQSDSVGPKSTSGWLMDSVMTYLEVLYGRGFYYVGVCLTLNFLAMYLGWQSSLPADAVNALLWMSLAVMYSQPITMVMASSDIYMFQVILGIFSVTLNFWCTFKQRYNPPSKIRITKRRPYRYGNTSAVSSTSDSPNNSPAPSLAGEVTQSEPAFNMNDNGPIDLDILETLSVGTPSRSNTRHIKAFGQFGDTQKFSSAAPLSQNVLGALGGQRPVLSPARFRPQTNNLFMQRPGAGNKSMFGPSSLFQDNGHGTRPHSTWTNLGNIQGQRNACHQFNLPNETYGNHQGDDRASLFSEPRSPTVVGTDSSHSSDAQTRQSSCQVHTTFQENVPPVPSEHITRPGQRGSELVWSAIRVLNTSLILGVLVWLALPFCTWNNFIRISNWWMEYASF